MNKILYYHNSDAVHDFLTNVKSNIFIHGANCQATMNSGIARDVKNRIPELYQAYLDFHMGRKAIELTEEQKAQVEALAAYLTNEQIADYFGITRPTFNSIMERDPEILLRYKRGKAKAIGAVAQGLLQQARNGDKVAAMFYLKTQAGWRETSRHELTGADGDPIEFSKIERVILDDKAKD